MNGDLGKLRYLVLSLSDICNGLMSQKIRVRQREFFENYNMILFFILDACCKLHSLVVRSTINLIKPAMFEALILR